MEIVNEIADRNAIDILYAIMNIAITLITLVLTWAATKLPAKWRNEAEAALRIAEEKFRSSLHMAAVTGVTTGRAQGLTGTSLVRFTMVHILQSVPDAIKGLAPSAAEIIDSGPADMILDRLPGGLRRVLENIVMDKIAKSM